MRVVIALGSNLGDRAALIESAIEAMKRHLSISHVSTLIETAPVGGPEQGKYLNGVLIGDSSETAAELMEHLLAIESSLGRVRSVPNAPRTIDLDLIDYEGIIVDSPSLQLPHPRAHERAFVLLPWLEIGPDAYLVGHGSVRELVIRNGWL